MHAALMAQAARGNRQALLLLLVHALPVPLSHSLSIS
jgi:hypothetical protein